MKTLLKLRDFAACVMDALLTDPLNSRVCWVAIVLGGTWMGIVVGSFVLKLIMNNE